MANTSLDYRDKFLRRQLQYDRKFRVIFNKVADDFARLANDPNAKFTKSFKFNDAINKKIDIIIEGFHKKTLDLTELEIGESWGLSNQKNDIIVDDYLKTISGIKSAQKAKFFLPNVPALKAFISGTHGVETLSKNIWEVADQLKGELKIHLGLGLANGDSAPVISRRIRQYLRDPESYFRRVRDSKGRLVASKAMLENRPGQGVYNSAFKNAMRVARQNTNTAYLLADNLRWSNLDMVIGIHIEISAQHKIYDICDECQGDYPKTFVWTGWHVLCLCHQVPILMPQEDFKAYLKGSEPLKATQLEKMPDNFIKYTKENFERYSNYKSTPYWIADNENIIKNVLKSKK